MENSKPKYWKGFDELNSEPEFEKNRHNEFAEKLPLDEIASENDLGLTSGRRDFLKFFGFGISAATLAACSKTPVKKIVPYVIKPVDYEPGIANYYATTCGGCQARCQLLVKTKEGRPIKIEGHDESPMNKGAACAVGQSTVLSLYDVNRLSEPRIEGAKAQWTNLDKAISSKLASIAAAGGKIVVLTGSVNGPATMSAIREFTAKYPTASHVQYDAVSYSALRDAHASAGGPRIPDYRIDEAKVLVSFGADFLGTWLSPVEFTKKYVAARKVDNGQTSMLRHFQFESTLSLSGSNADYRAVLAPSQYGAAILSLHNKIAQLAGQATAGQSNLELMGNTIQLAAKNLWENRGKGIVITDSNDPDHQLLVASINSMLGNYGSTIDLDNPSLQRQGDDKAVISVINDLKAGKIAAIIIGHDINPVYSLPNGKEFGEAIKKAGLSISFAERVDETAKYCQYIAPTHHELESWNDHQPKSNLISLSQPTITPIFSTRGWQESLLKWSGNNTDYYTYLRSVWTAGPLGGSASDENWTKTVEKGFIATERKATTGGFSVAAGDAASRVKAGGGNAIELVLFEKVSMRDGQMANNPWLQELPDPVTKVSWDGYALLSPKHADELNLRNEDIVEITANGNTIKAAVVRQPGQRYKTIAVSFGYGRNVDGSFGKVMNPVGGPNAFALTSIVGNYFVRQGQQATVNKGSGKWELALTQTHHHMEGRDLVRETSLAELAKGNTGVPADAVAMHKMSMYRDYRFAGHHWGMAVDLNACTGCNACVIACNAENNIPVVGKDEVRRRREMHWMRIDRYYTVGDTKGTMHNKYKEIDAMESDGTANFENVRVVFQPLMCQHCENAPCENVCPVNAINHSSEGLNQQIYNRCVGTRYCANNCPYKVRRFNWFTYYNNDDFDYNLNDDLGRMVLNPDVTVRMRGVMEKCTFCVQRIQTAKLEAKKENRGLRDGDIRTACQQTCPANAIVFGDVNDKNSEIYKLVNNQRNYEILTEINTRPAVHYLSKVRATEEMPS